MSNINRDYLIVLNPKTSKVTVPELNYYIYDKYTANLFVNLVTTEGGKVVNLPDADQYKLVLHVLKPTNEIQDVENIQVFNKEKALFQIELDHELTKNIGRYKCELLTIDKTDHIVQSAKFSYRVKKSIYNDLDVVTETPQYPIIINLLDKLQDIDKYEAERRANEVARVAAEKARVKDYTDLRQTVTTDIETMQEKIDSFDGKVQEVDNAVQQMTTNINKYQTEKNKELDNYKTQKDTQINTAITDMENTIDKYKTEKDTQINDKFNQQDNKIDSAIDLQNKNIQASTKALNDKLDAAVQDQNNTIAANNQAQNKVISDAITEQNKTINTVVENDKIQNNRLTTLETSDTNNKAEIKKLQDKDVEHENRMTAIEAVDVEQNNRLDAIEIKNDQQDSRLNDVEAKNKKQDLDLKCLFAESHSERITLDDEVGNSVFLQNSKQGFATVDELKGNTLVNCNKDTDKELILNGNIDTSGYTSVTTTEGVDGGKVDVALEGNTMVNVCDQEDPVAITKSYTVETGNHIALQGEYDGKCRPNIYGNTLVNLAKDINPPTSTVENFENIEITDKGNYVEYKMINALEVKVVPRTDWVYKMNVDLVEGKTYTVIIPNMPLTAYNDMFILRDVGNAINYTSPKNTTFWSFVATKNGSGNYSFYMYTTNNYNLGDTITCNMPKKILILEGDYTNKPIPDYFTGMKSSFEDKLITDENDANNGKYKVDYKVTGKNLIAFTELGDINTTNGEDNNKFTMIMRTSYIFLKANHTYYITNPSLEGSEWFANIRYDKDKNFIGVTYENNETITPKEDMYLRIKTHNPNQLTWNIQLEEGTTATTYEPYKEQVKTLYLNTPLLEGDTIEQSGNNIIHNHRYGQTLIDGLKDCVLSTTKDGNTYVDKNVPNVAFMKDSNKPIMDKFNLPVSNPYSNSTSKGIFGMSTDESSFIRIRLEDNKDTTLEQLQQNPITVIYKLATPTQEIISTNDNLILDSYTNGHLDVDTVVPIDKVVFQPSNIQGLKYLSPNTEYTIQFESDNIGKLHYYIGGAYDDINVVKGINKFNLTTESKINWLNLDLSGIGFNMSKIVVTPKVDNDFGYFKGMKSVGECEGNKIKVLAQNNLADIMDNNLSLSSDANANFNIANIKGGKTYTIKIRGEVNKGFNLLNGYNTEMGYITKESLARNCFSSTYVIKPKYDGVLRFNGYASLTISSITLTEGEYTSDTIPNYQPYKSNKQTMTHEPLRGLPNGVKDKYVIIDGKWYIERNCGYGLFDGSDDENWVVDNQNGDNGDTSDCVGFKIEVPNIIESPNGYGTVILGSTIISNNLRTTDLYGKKVDGINFGWGKFIFVKCSKSIVASDFKSTLSLKPLMVVYPLEQPTYEPIDYNPFEVYTDTTHISNNSTIPCNMVIRNSGFNCILKPNTTYTVSSNNGLSSVTTKDSIGDSVLRFYNKDTTSITKMSNVLVLEGDYITGNPPIPAFFKGMESAFEQELVTDENDEHYGKYKVNVKAVGKNLFDGELELGNIIYSSGVLTNTNNSMRSKNYIRVKPSTLYTITSSYNTKDVQYVFEYDYNKNFIQFKTVYGKITTTSKTAFIKFKSQTNNANNYSLPNNLNINIQIEQGDKATEYEPYKENNITFYLNEPLRGVNNIKDKIYVKEDKVVVERNCGSITFDGSEDENWGTYNNVGANGSFCITIKLPNKMKTYTKKGYAMIICNKLPYIENGYTLDSTNISTYVMNKYSSNNIYVSVMNAQLKSKDKQGVIQWVQANPITVVYQLATPTYEEVEYFDLKLFVEIFKDTTINYNSNIPVTSTINYTYSTPLTDSVNTVSDISDQQDSMIIDMATQIATMEMMLM